MTKAISMSGMECADNWRKVVKIYKDLRPKNNPEETARHIINELGYENTLYVFSVVAQIKSWDGRISRKNREFLKHNVNTDENIAKWERGNPMIYAGLDDIHSAHIDNLITEMRFI